MTSRDPERSLLCLMTQTRLEPSISKTSWDLIDNSGTRASIGPTIGRLSVRGLLSVYHCACWQVTVWVELSTVAGHHSFFRAVGSWSLDGQRWWIAEDKADAMLTLSSALYMLYALLSYRIISVKMHANDVDTTRIMKFIPHKQLVYNKKAVLSQRWPRDARYISRSWAVAEIWPFEIIQDGGVEFVRIENSAIRFAVPENPTL